MCDAKQETTAKIDTLIKAIQHLDTSVTALTAAMTAPPIAIEAVAELSNAPLECVLAEQSIEALALRMLYFQIFPQGALEKGLSRVLDLEGLKRAVEAQR